MLVLDHMHSLPWHYKVIRGYGFCLQHNINIDDFASSLIDNTFVGDDKMKFIFPYSI